MITFELYKLYTWVWIAIAVVTFVSLLKITAPYGRHTKTTWGPLIGNKLGWFIMEFFVLVVLFYFVFTGSNTQSMVNLIILGLFALHYINRSIVFPLRIKTNGKKMPISIMFMALFFNLNNGFLIGYYLGEFKVYTIDWLQTPQFIIGTFIFVVGMAINWHSDTLLINLRKPGETGYKIPQGGLFKYVSCPNLFGETLEWAGFAVLTWSLPGLAFFVWTFANLIPRAISHHNWYKEKFEDYPKERKAVLPFIW
jgi:3-oxo-5-alpha-steroid 4-dehydrogenase 1